MSNKYFIGIDIGTQGARCILLDDAGMLVAVKEDVFPLVGDSRQQQSPEAWWQCCTGLMPALIDSVKALIDTDNIVAIAVTSTSGTIIPIDGKYNPLHPAIMYSDPRSAEEAAFCREVADAEVKKGYTAFNASSGLPKMRWFLNNFPALVPELHKFIHAADFITGRLCGEYHVTDYTNALKSGYDLHRDCWPGYIQERIGIRREWLQQVRPSGEPLAVLSSELALAWGLSLQTMVTTGITDGCASQIASGAVSLGQWNTTIGTTLVIKGVTQTEIKDPSGAIYNHRHPAGYWMPGGASNTGADWVSKLFAGEDLEQLGKQAAENLPAESLGWPLIQTGERFPFVSPQANGFWPAGSVIEKFTACMEGVGFIERYAYEKISQLSGEPVNLIFSAGGGSYSDTWLLIRSCITRIPVCKMKNVSGAAGAAILAASLTHYNSLQQAAAAMVHPEITVKPDLRLADAYEKKYQRFIDELQSRKILNTAC